MKTRTTLLLALFSLLAFHNFAQVSYQEKTESNSLAEKIAIVQKMEARAQNLLAKCEKSKFYCGPKIKPQFDTERLKADKLFANEEYAMAKVAYENLAKKSESPYCRKMIDECIRYDGEGRNCYQDIYAKVIYSADKYYTECKLEKAYLMYERANILRPCNEHVEQRLSELEDNPEANKPELNEL
ncbi:MAG: hypothetical protein ACI837_001059 [Crocinitomicaceae bacterium]|jgi:hypothetical protein